MKNIHLWGVRQNNLKGIEVEIPLGSLTVICGPSGSGKSSLAFETLYSEGQRRYTESLSNYTKQFLNKAPKPDIEGIENIPPAISIEQKNTVKSSRSTVGTTTEVVDYLRLLFEKIGQVYCPDHHLPLEKDTLSSGAQKVLGHFEGQRGYILAPVPSENRLVNGKKLREQLVQDGFLRIYVPAPVTKAASKSGPEKRRPSTKKILRESQDAGAKSSSLTPYYDAPVGEVLELTDPRLTRSGAPKEDFFLVIDRLGFSKSDEGRLIDSLHQAYAASLKYNNHQHSGQALIVSTTGRHLRVSEDLSCSICSRTFPSMSSRFFSFNSPVGACPTCNGFGNLLDLDEGKVVPDPQKSIAQGALSPFTMPSAARDRRTLLAYCNKAGIDIHTPWTDLPKEHRGLIWNGTKEFFGVRGLFEYLETKKYKMHVRVFLSRYKSPFTCPSCRGSRLRAEVQQVLIQHKSISDYCAMTVAELAQALQSLQLTPAQAEICRELHRQLNDRLRYLVDVGVGYLTLDRPTRTLSGGEFQRLNLANQLGMGLSQTLYVLDEPTVGLHPRDSDRLIKILKQLRQQGNTLVVVEHDPDVILNSTHVIEMGPGSGHLGGDIIFSGQVDDFLASDQSNTARYLRPSTELVVENSRRPINIETYRYKLGLKGCKGNNLKDVDLEIPLNRLVTVTGVSGSGKSSLITNTLYPAMARHLGVEFQQGLPYLELAGANNVKDVLLIDQSPIGKTARSNPVTYMKVFDAIRTIMGTIPEAKAQGFSASSFSLNVEGGRCPVCKGLGHEVIDMMFMDDLEILCDACDGKKFRPEILEIKYRDKNIYEILNMTVAEAMNFFVAYPNIRRPLSILKEVGLDYLRLGQNASTLSGGESQRLKVAREFNSANQKATLYILDEPTTGLHFREVHLLIKVLNRLVDGGGSVLLIEHNLEVIRHSDWVVDLGPEAGAGGGKLIYAGTPAELVKNRKGYTGRFLKEYLERITPSAPSPSTKIKSTTKNGESLNS